MLEAEIDRVNRSTSTKTLTKQEFLASTEPLVE
jgi:hypothetical protein